MTLSSNRSIEFVQNDVDYFVNAILKRTENQKNVLIKPFNKVANEIKEKLSIKDKEVKVYADSEDNCREAEEIEKSNIYDVNIIIYHVDNSGEKLSELLYEAFNLEQIHIIAPVTDWFYKNKPLFLVSVPKSGTHLLNNMMEVIGYERGIQFETFPDPGKWYCLEYSNSHTSAKDFFIDSVRRAPYGNRLHPFLTSPVIFMYRNPLDILVSEANYYHKEGKTAFSGYLNNLDFNERIERLYEDPWLLGSFRERIGSFIAWLDFQNVIPVSFEEIIGEKGGGDLKIQESLIWSMLLKLQVPGNVSTIANNIFNESSPTFHKGQIGAYKNTLPEKLFEKIKNSNQDYINAYGYSIDMNNICPSRFEEFRKRPLKLMRVDDVAIAIEYNYLSYNLVQYRGWIYAVPQKLGPSFNLGELEEEALNVLIRSKSLSGLKARLIAGKYFMRLITNIHEYKIFSIIKKFK